MGRVENLDPRAARDEELTGVRIDPQAVRPVLSARGLPRRGGLVRGEVDREREVLVLEIRVEPAVLRVDREALGVALERELRLLVERLGVEDPDGLVAGRGDPDLFLTRDVG